MPKTKKIEPPRLASVPAAKWEDNVRTKLKDLIDAGSITTVTCSVGNQALRPGGRDQSVLKITLTTADKQKMKLLVNENREFGLDEGTGTFFKSGFNSSAFAIFVERTVRPGTETTPGDPHRTFAVQRAMADGQPPHWMRQPKVYAPPGFNQNAQ